ncbi:MAG TPA: hypothetical protein VI078_00275 [bacterium]
MLKRGVFAGLALLALVLVAGCGGDDKGNPFKGDWASTTAGRLSFDDSHWRDADGDSGTYAFSGTYPEYAIVFRSAAGEFPKLATFLDVRTFDLCQVAAGGVLFDCNQFVWDKPTLH